MSQKKNKGDLTSIVSLLGKGDLGCLPQQLPIGVFDSGVGGLTVLRALKHRLPQENFLYFGDTQRVPYGTRTQAEILVFVRQILTWMTQQPVKMAIMACNTSSALALDIVRTEFDIPILGLILPGARSAVQQGQRIGVIATPATIESDSYRQAIWEINPNVHVEQIGCPEFVPLIEQNQLEGPDIEAIVRQRLQPLLEAQIDTLIYGCTHYPHLAPIIRAQLPSSVRHVDPADPMAAAAAQELKILQLQNSQKPGADRFCVSDYPDHFAKFAYHWLGSLPVVEKIVLPEASVVTTAAIETHTPSSGASDLESGSSVVTAAIDASTS